MGDRESKDRLSQYVYEGVPLPESAAECEKEMVLFATNFPLILANSELILKTPEYFHIRHSWSKLGGIYIGVSYLPLGCLLLLWQDGYWIGDCPDCNSRAYIFTAGGSPLSGSHYSLAVCSGCSEIVHKKKVEGFARLIVPAEELIKRHTQQRRVFRSKGTLLSCSRGVVGEDLPDQVVEDVVTPVSLDNLIATLNGLD